MTQEEIRQEGQSTCAGYFVQICCQAATRCTQDVGPTLRETSGVGVIFAWTTIILYRLRQDTN